MSARAAARLETLGFGQVYRYQPGRADWFAAGLPREGTEASTPRVADIAQRDVPTCGTDEPLGTVRDRVRRLGGDVCVVVDDAHVVLGLVQTASLDVAPDTPVAMVMDSSPITFRPNVPTGQLPEYLTAPRAGVAVVTTSDGVLIGLLRVETPERPAPAS